jgi:hypothetical protein
VNKQRDIGFTQGAGCAIAVLYKAIDQQCAEQLFGELNIPLSDYEEVCDEGDLTEIRAAAQKA